MTSNALDPQFRQNDQTQDVRITVDPKDLRLLRNYYTVVTGNTLGCHKQFIDRLNATNCLKEVNLPEKSDFIWVFCPIVSRQGSDIEEALKQIPNAGKPAILVVLYHTFNHAYVLPDCGRHVCLNTNVILIVQCLFHDSIGLLQCSQNNAAAKKLLKELEIECERSNPLSCDFTEHVLLCKKWIADFWRSFCDWGCSVSSDFLLWFYRPSSELTAPLLDNCDQ